MAAAREVLLLLLAASGLNLVLAGPQVGNALVRCEDPILDEMENNFGDCAYVLRQVACLTRREPVDCDERQQPLCCDHVGMRLRELAPVAIEDRDESTCPDRECVCVKRSGKKILDRLKSGRSSGGVRYSALHDHVSRYFAAAKTNPEFALALPKKLEKMCD